MDWRSVRVRDRFKARVVLGKVKGLILALGLGLGLGFVLELD